MYTFNDHYGYGLAEMVENLASRIPNNVVFLVLTIGSQLLDFRKAKTPREEWVVVETMAHWISSREIEPFRRKLQGDAQLHSQLTN